MKDEDTHPRKRDCPTDIAGFHSGTDSCAQSLCMLNRCPQATNPPFPSATRSTTVGGMDLRLEYRDHSSVFRTADAPERGVTSHALKTDRHRRALYRGVRIDESAPVPLLTPTWADDAWMDEALRLRAVLALCPTAVGFGLTAARLFGLPLPRDRTFTALHVASTNPVTKLRHPAIAFHRPRRLRSVVWLDLPLQSPTDIFVELALLLSRDALIALGDAIVGGWHGPPLCSLAELRDDIAQRRYLRARATTQEACALIRETVDSPQETGLRLWALRRGLPEPEVHPQVFCPLLGRVVEPDLGYRRARLALEYEGGHHFESKEQWTRDINRDEGLHAAGWTVLRVTSRTDRRQLEAKIRAHLERE